MLQLHPHLGDQVEFRVPLQGLHLHIVVIICGEAKEGRTLSLEKGESTHRRLVKESAHRAEGQELTGQPQFTHGLLSLYPPR